MSTATEELVGQADLFEGKIVSGVLLDVGKVGEVEYDVDDDRDLVPGDRITIQCEYVVRRVIFDEKYDKLGIGTQPMKRVQSLKALPGSVVIRKVQRQSDMQAAWEREHGKP